MRFILPLVLVIALASFILGATLKNSFISPFNQVASKDGSGDDSAGLISDKGSLPVNSGESAPAGSIKPGSNQKNNSYSSQDEGDKYVLKGTYNMSTYKMGFTINIPKSGGDISGSVTGVCEGTITGKADQPGIDNEAFMRGQYSGNCKPIPGLSFKTKAEGTFEGTIKYNQGKAGVIYINKEPYETRGYFELFL